MGMISRTASQSTNSGLLGWRVNDWSFVPIVWLPSMGCVMVGAHLPGPKHHLFLSQPVNSAVVKHLDFCPSKKWEVTFQSEFALGGHMNFILYFNPPPLPIPIKPTFLLAVKLLNSCMPVPVIVISLLAFRECAWWFCTKILSWWLRNPHNFKEKLIHSSCHWYSFFVRQW